MTADKPTPQDDEFAGLLEACDDALATGKPLPTTGTGDPPAELRPRLERGLSCLRRLQKLRPGHAPQPTLPTLLAQPGEPLVRVGRFEVVRELGRGGFGIVYLARDPALGRHVALKVPHAEVLMTPDLRERFRQEARAAAALDHPHLVPVYEVGEAGPFAYLVSAYCPGGSLGQWLRQRTEPVPHRLAAELVRPLAEAVAHAHSRGVLHRDIKPENILLQKTEARGPRVADSNPSFSSVLWSLSSVSLKLADFGLAKLLDGATGPTRSGAILGTPSYMAPEQAAGRGDRVGAAADVYALGAVFYELLTGRPPFEAESAVVVLNQVLYVDPVPPRRLRPSVPRDLETICLKCLEKEPKRRYATAQDLAADLGRFLEGRPVKARRIGPLGRTWRWAKRRPAVASLLLALVLALAGGFAGVYVLWQQAVALAEANGRERDDARRAWDRADANYKQARAVVDRLSRLGELLASRPGLDPTRQAALDAVLTYYEEFLRQRGDDPAIRRDWPKPRSGLESCGTTWGEQMPADALRRAGELLDGLLVDSPDDVDVRRDRAVSNRWLGHILRDTKHYSEALACYAAACAMQEGLLADHPDSAFDAMALANTLLNRADIYATNLRRWNEAETDLRRLEELHLRLLAAQPHSSFVRYEAGLGQEQFAELYWSTGRYTEAEEAYRKAIGLLESNLTEGPESDRRYHLARVLNSQAQYFWDIDRTHEAIPVNRRAIGLLERAVGDSPSIPTYRILLSEAWGDLAQQLAESGDADVDAEAAWRKSLDQAGRLVATFPADPTHRKRLSERRVQLASWLESVGRHADAAKLLATPPPP